MAINFDETKQTAKRIARRTLWISLIGLLIFATGYYFYRTFAKSEGTRTGVLFKISKKGYAFKTFEGQLHLGGSSMMTPQSVWDFSVKNETIYTQMQALEGKNVKCSYEELIDAFPWQGDTDYIVYKVEQVQ